MIRLLLVLLFTSITSYSQVETTWETFADIKFEEKYYEEDDAYYWVPSFGPKLSMIEGQEVRIKGYVIEIDPAKGFYVLSKYPNSACFFCGGAGPETIIELEFTERQSSIKMDDFVTIQGKLKLNAADIYHCNYILETPEIIQD